ncbi:MAG: GHMP kinase [Nitrososphaera sp.]|jgi:D-glycero-alpha-D-manno-heptose-7-phosphate kinase
MIITRTPLRISLFGGGTDFRDFYKREYGAVVGFAINKYVYVMTHKRFEKSVRAGYSQIEIVEHYSHLKHDLIREGLHRMDVKGPIDVSTIADVPATGTGLGSSGSVMVGILSALSSYSKKYFKKEEIVRIACDIEINRLKKPIGKQDQYFAAYGGLSYFKFNPDESVRIERLNHNRSTVVDLQNNILCFYTGVGRNSHDILLNQQNQIKNNLIFLHEIRDLADTARSLLKKGDITKFGEMLNTGWELKKKLSSNISSNLIDLYYKKAIKAGALGGKINGAGGGGFLTFYCEKRYQGKVRQALRRLREIDINISDSGSSIIFNNEN